MKTLVKAKVVFSIDTETSVDTVEIENNPENVQEALRKEAFLVIKETGTSAGIVYSSETHPQLAEVISQEPADLIQSSEGQPA